MSSPTAHRHTMYVMPQAIQWPYMNFPITTKEYGKSFSNRNLRHIRQFYRVFPKWNAVRSELSWTHYRLLLKIEREDAKTFYMQEAIECNWSTRTLEGQVNSLYFERMVMTKKEGGKKLVKAEAETKKSDASQRHYQRPVCTGIFRT